MWGGKGVLLSTFPMRLCWAFVHCRCATGERDAVRDVPKYPPGRDSSWVRELMGRPARVMCARRARRASSRALLWGDGLKLVDVGCDLTFTHVKVDARPLAELLYYGE
jgi:hypothetical protein